VVKRVSCTALALCAIVCAACSRRASTYEMDVSTPIRQITGAGATLPYPLYSSWFAEYNRLHPDVRINYQSQGSGAGIRQLLNRTVFFGATDQPMTDAQLRGAPGPILHLPTVIGAVVPVYNLPGVTHAVRFTGPLIAQIVLGRIRKWNEPPVAAINPGITLPDTDIVVVHRSDGSGTTFVLADYLAKVSPDFASAVGVDASVRWPVGVGGKGNEGVAGLVQQTPGAFGYLELQYAVQNSIAQGAVLNKTGRYVTATVDSAAAAALPTVATMPADFRVSITDPVGADAYPISSFTWMLVYRDAPDVTASRTIVDFMHWALTEGQKTARRLGYTPLPAHVITMEIAALETIKTQ
jgi:phosphate transport system substrate-binding protein